LGIGADKEVQAQTVRLKPDTETGTTRCCGSCGAIVPEEGYLAAILYDLGRLLAVNPPSMLVVTHPPQGHGHEPVVREVRSMYDRSSPEGRKGALLLTVDAEQASPRFFLFQGLLAP
jgi:hypothetical protein